MSILSYRRLAGAYDIMDKPIFIIIIIITIVITLIIILTMIMIMIIIIIIIIITNSTSKKQNLKRKIGNCHRRMCTVIPLKLESRHLCCCTVVPGYPTTRIIKNDLKEWIWAQTGPITTHLGYIITLWAWGRVAGHLICRPFSRAALLLSEGL